MNDLAPITDLVDALLRNTAPADRRSTLRTAARDLQKSRREGIAAQRNPDGSPFEPRKAKPSRKGRIRRKAMFRKLRLARFLKAGATADEAWVGFTGRAAGVARIHQEGLADAPGPGQAKVRYARRLLLGLAEPDRQRVLDRVFAKVTDL